NGVSRARADCNIADDQDTLTHTEYGWAMAESHRWAHLLLRSGRPDGGRTLLPAGRGPIPGVLGETDSAFTAFTADACDRHDRWRLCIEIHPTHVRSVRAGRDLGRTL